MGCNCKNVSEISKRHSNGTEPISSKVGRLSTRVLLIAIALVLTIVLTPVIMAVVAYKLAFTGENTVVIPKFLMKAKTKNVGSNGQELQGTY